MLGTAEHTQYDLRFRLLGIPVRVSPWFWLIMLMLSGDGNDTPWVVSFIACAFLSILVHEYGHGLSSRAFGTEPEEIVLHGMGGYCLMAYSYRATWKQIVILICGPGAGFLLFGLVVLAASATYQANPLDVLALSGIGSGTENLREFLFKIMDQPVVERALFQLLQINLWWGLLNLLPIWPLDGGRIAQVGLSHVSRRNGERWGHVVSMVTAGILACYFLSVRDYWRTVWFGAFVFMNYQVLQGMHGSYRSGGGRWEY